VRNLPIGTRSDSNGRDGAAACTDGNSDTLEDHADESEEGGSSDGVGRLDGVAALNGSVSCISSCENGKERLRGMTYPVLHWLAGEVAVGAAVTVTVVVLVGGGEPPGVAAARMARVAKMESWENIVGLL
jgi:hypothetical protein